MSLSLGDMATPGPPDLIHVEGIGAVRLLTEEQTAKLRRGSREIRQARYLAFCAGMPLHQFNRLPAEQQEAIRLAVNMLTSPHWCGLLVV